jgi:ribosomal protein L12E/L44/L45/RPP1/RPP2
MDQSEAAMLERPGSERSAKRAGTQKAQRRAPREVARKLDREAKSRKAEKRDFGEEEDNRSELADLFGIHSGGYFS